MTVPRPATPSPPPVVMVDIMRLIEDHDRIDALSRRIVDLASAARPDIGATLATLSELAFLVTAHLSAEDTSIYPMLAAGQPIPRAREPQDLVAELDALKADWGRFLSEWSADCVAADWSGFRDEADAMLTRLRERVACETSLIYPFALRTGVIRLRPAPAN